MASHHARQQAASGRHVDHRLVRDPGDRPGVAAADPERIDVEPLQAHLDVPVLDRREHLLGNRHVLLDDEVALLDVVLDQAVPFRLLCLHTQGHAVPPVVRGRLEHEPLAVVGDERQQVYDPVAVILAALPQHARPGDRLVDHATFLLRHQMGEARVLE